MIVWIIDVDPVRRALLRAELIARGHDALGYVTVRDAIDAVLESRPGAIVVNLRGQPLPLVERLPQLGVPVTVIGDAEELAELPEGGWIAMPREVGVGEIADRVTQ